MRRATFANRDIRLSLASIVRFLLITMFALNLISIILKFLVYNTVNSTVKASHPASAFLAAK
jgi:hypothetical protein